MSTRTFSVRLYGGPCDGTIELPIYPIQYILRVVIPSEVEYVPELDGSPPIENIPMPEVAIYQRVKLSDGSIQYRFKEIQS